MTKKLTIQQGIPKGSYDSSSSFSVEQSSHGFAVGNGIYHDGSSFVKAIANDVDTLAGYVVVKVIDANKFVAADFGRENVPSHGFTIGEYYFLSDSSAGDVVTSSPTAFSSFSCPLFYVEDANTLHIKVYRPESVRNDVIKAVSENVSARDALAITAAGNIIKLDASDDDKMEFIGFAANDALNTENTLILFSGRLGGFSGLQAGEFLYADPSSPGAYTQTKPNSSGNYVIVLGKAISATEIIVNPDLGVSTEFIAGNDTSKETGFINYIVNGDAEDSTEGWNVYADTVAALPTDGIGGSPSVTLTSEVSSEIRGNRHFRLAKDAANRQGQGCSYDFTIDKADQGKKLTISFDYIASANLSDNDINIFVYDITNSQLVRLEFGEEFFPSDRGSYLGRFQANSNSTSYRLIFHVASTKATAYTLDFDTAQISVRSIAQGVIVTDWKSYTTELTHDSGAISNNLNSFRWRRVGDTLEVRGLIAFSGASSAFSGLRFSIPSGMTMDNSKLVALNVNTNVGEGQIHDSGLAVYPTKITVENSTRLRIRTTRTNSGTNPVLVNSTDDVTSTNPATWANNDSISVKIAVPILGWSSNSQMSESGSNREVQFIGTSGVQSIAGSSTDTPVTIALTANTDTTNSFASNIYTIPVTGTYSIAAHVGMTVEFNRALRVGYGISSTSFTKATITHNGLSVDSDLSGSVFGEHFLVKGQTVRFLIGSSNTGAKNLISDGRFNRFSIKRISNPQTIFQSDKKIVNPNLLINGNFDLWQRGTSTSSISYLADRTYNYAEGGATFTTSRQEITQPSTELFNARYFHRSVVTTGGGAGSRFLINHKIEDVTTLACKQVTLSFWAKADSAKNIAIEFSQNFGSGGSPSTQVNEIGVKTHSLTTVWQKYTQTFRFPCINGKTIGTSANTSATLLTIWFDAGSNFNARTNSLGNQSGTFDIAQVKLEEGDSATPFVLAGGNIAGELQMAQRYYELDNNVTWQGYSSAGSDTGVYVPFKASKRVTPTIVQGIVAGGGFTNTINSPPINTYGFVSKRVKDGVTGAGFWVNSFTADAEF